MGKELLLKFSDAFFEENNLFLLNEQRYHAGRLISESLHDVDFGQIVRYIPLDC